MAKTQSDHVTSEKNTIFVVAGYNCFITTFLKCGVWHSLTKSRYAWYIPH